MGPITTLTSALNLIKRCNLIFNLANVNSKLFINSVDSICCTCCELGQCVSNEQCHTVQYIKFSY